MNESSTSRDVSRRLLLTKRSYHDDAACSRLCRQAKDHGFDGIVVPPVWTPSGDTPVVPDYGDAAFNDVEESTTHALARLAAACTKEGLRLYMDIEPDGAAALNDWHSELAHWLDIGVAGFRCKGVARLKASEWARLIGAVRASAPHAQFMAWTPGLNIEQVAGLRGVGFDATFLSLPWWDYRSAWLTEEYARLAAVAPVIAPLAATAPARRPGEAEPEAATLRRRNLWVGAVCASGILVPEEFMEADTGAELKEANDWLAARKETDEALAMLTGPLSPCAALFRSGAGLVVNPDHEREAEVDLALLQARLPDRYTDLLGFAGAKSRLQPGDFIRFSARQLQPVKPAAFSMAEKRKLGIGVMSAPRIAIEHVRPSVDEGRFAVKSIVGRAVDVEADIFMDGHEVLAACVAWRAADETEWREVAMVPVGNDRWQASFTPTRLGRHMFMIKAWHDRWESYRSGVIKKRDAGVDIALDLQEGLILASDISRRARREDRETADMLQGVIESADAGALLSDTVAEAMARLDVRPFETHSSDTFPVAVERRQAAFSSWYELFPRSQSATPGRHGRLVDVRSRLAAIRDMGFDVLYFPPIHPIGKTNRKGRNNSLTASAEDVGSPYAIGSEDGGHDAIHPELGTLEEFKDLLQAAREHGLEIALDFAIQCSPDHPWLKEHRNWFDWRPDGSLRYAENPPKRYEDIVNPDFYHGSQPKPRASLWRALRDIVLYWIDHGVRIFRVDNPHTKPLPFWEWMIGEVHARHPDVIFLSEAFTRPRMMYRLGKLGFSQSYTYFTWRNDKAELTSYLEELNAHPVADFYRPNFFVNTPDINPYFLQSSGRPGFLIRAALAATLSGSWGLYSGFELCESAALPGREEYLDSEKYELRQRDWHQAGNIIAEISQLNRIRHSTPALWSHLGLKFHPAHDDKVIFFSKATPERDSIVLVGICLDPQAARRAWVELPLWSWGLNDAAVLRMEDACAEREFELRGKYHEVEFTPQRPYFIWRVKELE